MPVLSDFGLCWVYVSAPLSYQSVLPLHFFYLTNDFQARTRLEMACEKLRQQAQKDNEAKEEELEQQRFASHRKVSVIVLLNWN